MSSGAGVNDACVTTFGELKLKKASKFIVFKLTDDNTEIVVEKQSPSTSYDEFLSSLPENECRYAVYDLEFDKGEGVRNKIVFIAWSPDNAKVKQKMVYAASKDYLRKKLVGIATEVQGTDLSEVAYDSVLEKAARNSN
ncbi:cofilin [Sorochytrium milnesiophthora]